MNHKKNIYKICGKLDFKITLKQCINNDINKKELELSLIDKYINSLSSLEQIAFEVAKIELESSFDIE